MQIDVTTAFGRLSLCRVLHDLRVPTTMYNNQVWISLNKGKSGKLDDTSWMVHKKYALPLYPEKQPVLDLCEVLQLFFPKQFKSDHEVLNYILRKYFFVFDLGLTPLDMALEKTEAMFRTRRRNYDFIRSGLNRPDMIQQSMSSLGIINIGNAAKYIGSHKLLDIETHLGIKTGFQNLEEHVAVATYFSDFKTVSSLLLIPAGGTPVPYDIQPSRVSYFGLNRSLGYGRHYLHTSWKSLVTSTDFSESQNVHAKINPHAESDNIWMLPETVLLLDTDDSLGEILTARSFSTNLKLSYHDTKENPTDFYQWLWRVMHKAWPLNYDAPRDKEFVSRVCSDGILRQWFLDNYKALNKPVRIKYLEHLDNFSRKWMIKGGSITETSKGYRFSDSKTGISQLVTNFTVHIEKTVIFSNQETWYYGYIRTPGKIIAVSIEKSKLSKPRNFREAIETAGMMAHLNLAVSEDKWYNDMAKIISHQAMSSVVESGLFNFGKDIYSDNYITPFGVYSSYGKTAVSKHIYPNHLVFCAFGREFEFGTTTLVSAQMTEEIRKAIAIVAGLLVKSFFNWPTTPEHVRHDPVTSRVFMSLFEGLGQITEISRLHLPQKETGAVPGIAGYPAFIRLDTFGAKIRYSGYFVVSSPNNAQDNLPSITDLPNESLRKRLTTYVHLLADKLLRDLRVFSSPEELSYITDTATLGEVCIRRFFDPSFQIENTGVLNPIRPFFAAITTDYLLKELTSYNPTDKSVEVHLSRNGKKVNVPAWLLEERLKESGLKYTRKDLMFTLAVDDYQKCAILFFGSTVSIPEKSTAAVTYISEFTQVK